MLLKISCEAVRKFEEYKAGYKQLQDYDKFSFQRNSPIREEVAKWLIRVRTTTQRRTRSPRTRLRRIIQKSRLLHEEAPLSAVQNDIGVQLINRSWMSSNS